MNVKEILKLKQIALQFTNPQAKFMDAVKHMAKLRLGSLLIIENSKLCGILTFNEVMDVIAENDYEHKLVSDVMQKNPTTAQVTMELNDLRKLMVSNWLRYVPVMDGDDIYGVISFHDIAKALIEETEHENKMLKDYIGQN